MIDNAYRFHFIYGDLFVYGDNMKTCIPYIDDAADSIDSLCKYCKHNNLRVFYKPKRTISGLISKPRVIRITKRHNVHSSWKELKKYVESQLHIYW